MSTKNKKTTGNFKCKAMIEGYRAQQKEVSENRAPKPDRKAIKKTLKKQRDRLGEVIKISAMDQLRQTEKLFQEACKKNPLTLSPLSWVRSKAYKCAERGRDGKKEFAGLPTLMRLSSLESGGPKKRGDYSLGVCEIKGALDAMEINIQKVKMLKDYIQHAHLLLGVRKLPGAVTERMLSILNAKV